MDGAEVRLCELVAVLSLATDLALGRPLEHELRTTLLALEPGRQAQLSEREQQDLYFIALLRYVGCTGHAHEVSQLFGDEIAARSRMDLIDVGNPAHVVRELVRHAGKDRPLLRRAVVVGRTLAKGRGAADHLAAGCEIAESLAERLEMEPAVRIALRFAFERWDGKGFPSRAKHDQIPVAMRIVHLANDLEILLRVGGPEVAAQAVFARRGAAYDPAIVGVFLSDPVACVAAMDLPSVWDAVIEAEPVPRRTLRGASLDDALEVVADFVDLKSPDMAGHSRGVAVLAAAAGEALGFDDMNLVRLRRAGLLHDLGRTGISNAIWDKPGPLTGAEWERVRLHPYFTSRMLTRAGSLSDLAGLAADHHERIDGSGYHRQLKGSHIPLPSRVLAAADAYQAMTEPRRWRSALDPGHAAGELRAMAAAGRLDPEATNAVLGAAGHRVPKRGDWPAGLTNKEVEVLRLIARGQGNKQVAARLVISERTFAHHLQHAYAKIGVRSRGAAALFAIEHGLLPAMPS